MHAALKSLSVLTMNLAVHSFAFSVPAFAADTDRIALRPGETADLGTLYWVSNCRSILNGSPVAEVLDGPPELTVSVQVKEVLPRRQNCAKPVKGGDLIVTAAKEIKNRSSGKLFIRLKFPTKDGERQNTRDVDYTLFP